MGLELGPQELRASKMSAFPRVPKKARLAAFQRATEREILGEFQTPNFYAPGEHVWNWT